MNLDKLDDWLVVRIWQTSASSDRFDWMTGDFLPRNLDDLFDWLRA